MPFTGVSEPVNLIPAEKFWFSLLRQQALIRYTFGMQGSQSSVPPPVCKLSNRLRDQVMVLLHIFLLPLGYIVEVLFIKRTGGFYFFNVMVRYIYIRNLLWRFMYHRCCSVFFIFVQLIFAWNHIVQRRMWILIIDFVLLTSFFTVVLLILNYCGA